MTNEEKAEEYVMNHECITRDCNQYPNCDSCNNQHMLQAYLDGLEEGKTKWHDLRKDPNDLPDNGRRVLVKDKSRREYDIACLCRSKGYSDFWSYERFTTSVKDGYVVAWCELPKFGEK